MGLKDPEARRAYHREYMRRDRDAVERSRKKWRAAHPDYQRDWATQHPENRRATQRKYYEKQRACRNGEKVCTQCLEAKPASEFYPAASKCRPCTAKWARYLKFGVSPERLEALLAKQHGKCAICRAELNLSKKETALDHDHDTGEVRGLLCFRCNLAIGQFRDDPELCEAAANYLRERR